MAKAQPTDPLCMLPLRSRTCPQCGREFTYRHGTQPGYLKRLDERKRRFCAAACRVASQREHSHRPRELSCRRCGGTFISRRPQTRFCPACYKAASSEVQVAKLAGETRHCHRCQIGFTPTRKRQRFCSRACTDAHHTAQKQHWRQGQFIEEVSLGLLYLRDRGICQLCGKPVSKRLKWPHPGSASIDHRKPGSKGGEHSYANTQLAHLGCNSSKGAKLGT